MDNFLEDRKVVEQALQDYLSQSNFPSEVASAMQYAVTNGGKRIRPILVLEFCRIFGGNPADAMPFAVAIEMIHSYSLVHDDLPCMDDDDLRRGKPSCHKQFDEATALLCGDALLTKAFTTMATAPLATRDPKAVVDCVALLGQYAGIDGMIGGQEMDLAQENSSVTADELTQMHALKTGALLQAACQIGARVATDDAQSQAMASAYGKALGLAFQLVDDILDVVGTEEELGKPIGSDAENQKNNFITILGMEQTKNMASAYTEQAIGLLQELTNTDNLQRLTKALLDRRN